VISRVLNTFVMLLAILGILIALDLVSITSKVELQILRPSYLIDLKDVKASHLIHSSLPFDSLIKALAPVDTQGFILVDEPKPDSANVFKMKLATNGAQMFNCSGRVISARVLVSQLFPGKLQLPLGVESVTLETPEDKRIAIKCAFDHETRRVTKWAGLTCISSDSLLYALGELSTEYLLPLLMSRIVYNFISIENTSAEEVRDVTIRIIEPMRLVNVHSLYFGVVAWTLPEGLGASMDTQRSRIEFRVPALKGRGSIQLLIATQSAILEEQDIYLHYHKLKSIDKGKVTLMLLGSFVLSVILCLVESKGRFRLNRS